MRAGYAEGRRQGFEQPSLDILRGLGRSPRAERIAWCANPGSSTRFFVLSDFITGSASARPENDKIRRNTQGLETFAARYGHRDSRGFRSIACLFAWPVCRASILRCGQVEGEREVEIHKAALNTSVYEMLAVLWLTPLSRRLLNGRKSKRQPPREG